MDLASVAFADPRRADRTGVLALDDAGRLVLRASRSLAQALDAAVEDASVDLTPLGFDDRRRGLAFAAALARGIPANLVECETVAGVLELRAYVNRGWVRLTIRPGDFDSDAAWDFTVGTSEARLEASRA